jgi:hypothetical protein
VIKSICDWADGHKSDDKQARQQTAARSAARFLVAALLHAPLCAGSARAFHGIGHAVLERSAVTHLVLAIHWFRAQADWKSQVQPATELADLDRKGAVKVELIPYGYPDLWRFLLPFLFIRGLAAEIHEQIQGWKDEYPNARQVSVIAHGFGTYIIGWLLRNTPLTLYRLILCASVIPRRSDWWTVMRKSVDGDIRNDCSRYDICSVFTYSLWWYGETGTYGAQSPGVKNVVNSFHNHNAIVTGEFAANYWRPFLESGVIQQRDPELKGVVSWHWTSQLSALLRWAQIAAILVGVLLGWPELWNWMSNRTGEFGAFTSWNYDLGKDEAVVRMETSRAKWVAGRPYVVIVVKKGRDDTPIDEITNTVVSKILTFPELQSPVVDLHVPCELIARQIEYDDLIYMYAFVINESDIDRLRTAISHQSQHPLTRGQIVKDYGGKWAGGGGDNATFAVRGEILKTALESRESRLKSIGGREN